MFYMHWGVCKTPRDISKPMVTQTSLAFYSQLEAIATSWLDGTTLKCHLKKLIPQTLVLDFCHLSWASHRRPIHCKVEHWRENSKSTLDRSPLHKFWIFLICMPGTVLVHCTKQPHSSSKKTKPQEVKELREAIQRRRDKVGTRPQVGFLPAAALRQLAIIAIRMVSVPLVHVRDFMM